MRKPRRCPRRTTVPTVVLVLRALAPLVAAAAPFVSAALAARGGR